MEFKIDKFENHTLIKVLEEKLDTHIAPTLKSELVLVSGNGEKNIILDLGNCRYCDSSGLSAILVANRLCKNANGTFVLTGLNDAWLGIGGGPAVTPRTSRVSWVWGLPQ